MRQRGPFTPTRLATLGFLLLQIALAVPSAWATQDAPEDRAILQGFRSMRVHVAPLPPEVAHLGLRADQLQTDAEQRLVDHESDQEPVKCRRSGAPRWLILSKAARS
jgi:hypothetical protein